MYFLANYEYIFAQFDAQNLDLPLFLQFSCWLASLVELDRAREELEPSVFFRLVSKTSQSEPSHFTASRKMPWKLIYLGHFFWKCPESYIVLF
jgi:hypothetical protein